MTTSAMVGTGSHGVDNSALSAFPSAVADAQADSELAGIVADIEVAY